MAETALWGDDEFVAYSDYIVRVLSRNIVEAPAILSYEVQRENHRTWTRNYPEYWWWDDASYDRLFATLERLHPSVTVQLVPLYAMSVGVKAPNGKLFIVNRKGEVGLG